MQPLHLNKTPLFTFDFLAVSVVSMLTGVYSVMLMSTVLSYCQQIGMNGATAGLVSSIFAFAALLFRPVAGVLTDRLPQRFLFIAGSIPFVFCPVFLVMTESLWVLLLIRTAQGIGMSICSTVANTVASNIIPKTHFTVGIGYFGIGMAVSAAIAPALGLWLVRQFGYTGMFVASSAIAGIALLLMMLVRYFCQQIDSTVLRRISISSLYEKTAVFPSISVFFATCAQITVVQFLPLYALTKGSADISAFYIISAIGIVTPRLLVGVIKRYISDRTLITAGYCVLIGAFIAIQIANYSAWYFLPMAFVYGVAHGCVQMVLNSMAIVEAPKHRKGAANATFLAANDLGFGIAPVAWGAVSQLIGYGQIYFISAGILVVMLVSLRLSRAR